MLIAELFLEGWGGGTVQSALTWLAANLADSSGRGAVYHSKWGQGWGGACDVIFDCFSHFGGKEKRACLLLSQRRQRKIPNGRNSQR